MKRRLTAEAEERIHAFERRSWNVGCACHLSPPCAHCTDPDNPANVMEEDDAWEPDEPEIDYLGAARALIGRQE